MSETTAQTPATPAETSDTLRNLVLFGIVGALILGTGFVQSWNTALFILNFGLISAIMSLGVNLQWGFAGLFNVGVMGFVALGGLATVLVSMPPVGEAWAAGGLRVLLGLVLGAATVLGAVLAWSRVPPGRMRGLVVAAVVVAGFFLFRWVFDAGVGAVEAVNPASTGYLGGLGLPVLFAWPVGGLLAAGAAWLIGRIALGLRSDYLAIATLGISEIVIAVLKNEDWLARGVKNVAGLDSPVPSAVELQSADWFLSFAQGLGMTPIDASTLFVRVSYTVLFLIVLALLMWLSERALNSPWGRMMRAIRDNRDAAEAMGKDVVARHRQIFILGSGVVGVAGAMLVTMDGLFTPGTYNPLRYTFLIWVMVIVGGSGNNWGAVLGGFLIWFTWTQAEAWGPQAMEIVTAGMAPDSALAAHLMDNAPHMRLFIMGLVLLVTLRFFPKGLIPEQVRR